MESTAPTTRPATPSDACFTVTPASLAAAFASVPDPRRQASVMYPLPAVLTLAVAALLCAHTSVLAMAEWGAGQSAEFLRRLGFPAGRAPCQSTLHRLFRKLDGRALAAALGAYFVGTALPTGRGSQGVAIDGKAQRGQHQYDPAGPPVQVLAAFCHEQAVVLASEPIEAGADKQEAELTVAPALLNAVDWRNRVLTGDALFCQRQLCQQVLDAGGDYLLLVKANQPRLSWAIELLFDPPSQTPPLLDQREAHSIDQGHGRTAEVRHLIASTDLTTYLDWPGLAQVFRIERTWWEQGKQRRQVRYGITSLPPAIGTAQRLLALKRGHWSIENRLHRSKDVNLGEDASLIHQGQGPVVCSVLRDAALSLLHRAGCSRVASRLRYHSRHPAEAVALLRWSGPTHA
jgi:predicted transposase YbfD/YdcC